jgi:hypothetical protein
MFRNVYVQVFNFYFLFVKIDKNAKGQVCIVFF